MIYINDVDTYYLHNVNFILGKKKNGEIYIFSRVKNRASRFTFFLCSKKLRLKFTSQKIEIGRIYMRPFIDSV